MAKIYISSTYVDLKEEREAAAQAVRRLGHQSIAMEDYVAWPQRPVEKCLQDVRSCDAYVGIFAWRYGFIPDGYDKSITHVEYETAKKNGIPCLIFLTDPKAPWPVDYVATGKERKKIDRLRKEMMNDYIVSFFKNADDLIGKVSAAVSNLVTMTERSFIKFKRPEELIGTKIGNYVIREKLGRGGKGVVFKVMDTLEGREKAIKMVPPRVADSPVAFKDLKREVKIATSIIHPNVVKVLALEEHEGHFFIVMEYIEGKSLEQILADSRDGKLEETKVIEIMQKLARGLLETHKNNVIHRDIKPSNVMVTPGGQVKILDFGVSYQVTKSMTELVGEHQSMGTWPYMAPEQFFTRYGRENKQVDIWGFGVTMYQLLTGQFPFINKDQIKDKNEKPYKLAGVSGRTRNLVMKCLEKNRKRRFQNMEEVLKVLNSISKRKSKPKPKPKQIPKPKPKPKKTTLMKGSLAAASIIVLIVLVVLLIQPKKQKDIIPVKEKKPAYVTAVEKIADKVHQNDSGYWEADYGNGIIMVYIPPGQFKMGSNDGDPDEKSPHDVYLDGYWMGKTEVTVQQFRLFFKDTNYVTRAESSGGAFTWTGEKWEKKKDINWKNPGFKQDENHPVVCVSWDDAVKYCEWLSGKKDLKFKLPTEARWEKAGRGPKNNKSDKVSVRKYPWGDHGPYYNGKWYANYAAHDSWEKRGEDGYEFTSPVGYYKHGESPYGLLDMAGNVWEWCRDWYNENYYKLSLDKNPPGPESGPYRVLRGGGWYYNARSLRCSNRDYGGPSYRLDFVGFRLCQDN